MARKCQVSGKGTSFGNTISHSHIKTRRKFKVNLIRKRIYIPHENRWVLLRLSARTLRTLNKRGVTSLMRQYGQKLKILNKFDKGQDSQTSLPKEGKEAKSTNAN